MFQYLIFPPCLKSVRLIIGDLPNFLLLTLKFCCLYRPAIPFDSQNPRLRRNKRRKAALLFLSVFFSSPTSPTLQIFHGWIYCICIRKLSRPSLLPASSFRNCFPSLMNPHVSFKRLFLHMREIIFLFSTAHLTPFYRPPFPPRAPQSGLLVQVARFTPPLAFALTKVRIRLR